MKIPFNRPFFDEKEISNATAAIRSGKVGGNGPFGQKVEGLMRDLFGVRFALLTTSCTHALELSMMAAGIREGDEVILPSFSFVSAANAIRQFKARPVFVDIEEDSFNLDPLKVREAVNKKTKAIICVHYGGVSCDMKKLVNISEGHDLYLIEDAAQAVGSKYQDRYLGTIGDMGCLSFHETKNLTCGEGGAFLTNNAKIAKRVEVAREKGTNRSAFLRGDIDKYTWVDIGSSYVLSDILAAILLEQMKKLRYIINRRREIVLRYIEGLKALEKKGRIVLPDLGSGEDINWHVFYFRVENEKIRDYILTKLNQKGIKATFHFVPLHISPYAREMYGYKKGDLPITEKISSTLIRLPLYPGLEAKEQEYIIDSLYKILER